jgi:uncharacterized membrane protein YccC
MTKLGRVLGEHADRTVRIFVDLAHEVREVSLTGPRARRCLITAVAVALSVTIAQAMHLPYVWWAGISGFMSAQATLPGSLARAALRIAGTVMGAIIGFTIIPFVVYDHVACSLALMLLGGLGVLGMVVSKYGYAWLFLGITASMVLMLSLEQPELGFDAAVYRCMEVTIGSLSAVVSELVLAGDADDVPPPPAPGWSNLLSDEKFPAVLHAARSGISVAALPLVWSWLDLPSLSQMAITVAAVMAIPVLGDHPLHTGTMIISRAAHRVIGCLVGGLAALALLALPLTDLVPWLLALTGGVWVCTHVQGSERGVGYAGTQAAIVFIITLVQGLGPPDSILPGIDRLSGMLGGLTILLTITFVLGPADPTPDAPAASATPSKAS